MELIRFAPVLLALLQGCASPIMAIDAPGFKVGLSSAPTTEPKSMEEAIQKLNHVRAKYYEGVLDQVDHTQNSVTGLILLGTAITAMAAAKVHRDAVLGASLIGGAGYALTQTQLDARRLQILTEGIKALDCAREASLPADLGDERRAEVDGAYKDLVAQRNRVKSDRDVLEAEANSPLYAMDPKITAPARELVRQADLALVDAGKAIDGVQALLKAARGDELSLATNRISTRVLEATRDITVNPASVRQMVAGIGGFAAMFAPGAGFESSLGDALGKYNKGKPKAQAGVDTTRLDAAAQTLANDLALLGKLRARVTDLTSGVSVSAVSAALKKCDVTSVLVPLTFSPPTLELDEKKTNAKGFTVNGGSPPYEVTLLDQAEGLSTSFNGGLSDTVHVKATDRTPAGEYHIRVQDGSTPRLSQLMKVRVGPDQPAADVVGAGSGAGVEADPGAAPASVSQQDLAKAWGTFAASLKGHKGSHKGVSYRVEQIELVPKGAMVRIKCDKPAALPVADVREKLALAADKSAVEVLRSAGALDKGSSQLDLSKNATCIKA